MKFRRGGARKRLAVLALAVPLVLLMWTATAADPADRTPGSKLAGHLDGPGLGRSDASIAVIEYFSFSCPHCRRFHRDVFPKIRERYVDTGQVYFVLRDFPLNLAALKAAQAAWCKGPEGYVELHDALWAAWDGWIDQAETDPALVDVLVARGVARDDAEGCLTDGRLEARVLKSYLAGVREHGVDRTPTFIVGGRKYTGFLSLSRFEEILSEAAR